MKKCYVHSKNENVYISKLMELNKRNIEACINLKTPNIIYDYEKQVCSECEEIDINSLIKYARYLGILPTGDIKSTEILQYTNDTFQAQTNWKTFMLLPLSKQKLWLCYKISELITRIKWIIKKEQVEKEMLDEQIQRSENCDDARDMLYYLKGIVGISYLKYEDKNIWLFGERHKNLRNVCQPMNDKDIMDITRENDHLHFFGVDCKYFTFPRLLYAWLTNIKVNNYTVDVFLERSLKTGISHEVEKIGYLKKFNPFFLNVLNLIKHFAFGIQKFGFMPLIIEI